MDNGHVKQIIFVYVWKSIFSTEIFYWIYVIYPFNFDFPIDLKQSVFSEIRIKTFVQWRKQYNK